MNITRRKRLAKTLGKQLRTLRRESGMTQVDLAKALQISQPMVSRIESGGALPDLWTARRVTDIFGVYFLMDHFWDGWQ